MFKDKKMRKVVEWHLRQVNILLEHSKKEKVKVIKVLNFKLDHKRLGF